MLARLKSILFEGEVMRLMAMAVLVRPIGLVTQMLMANYFGAGAKYDAYILAFFLVNFVQMAFGRVFTAVVVPFAINLRKEIDERGLYRFLNASFLVFLVPGILFVLLALFRGNWLVAIAGPKAPPETRELTQEMLVKMAWPGLILLMVWMGKATLNLNKRFRVPGATPIVNSGFFLLVLVLYQETQGIWALPMAFTAGVVAQVILVIFWNLATRSFRFAIPQMPAKAGSRLWMLSWMILISTVFQTVNAFLDKMFASGLEPGSISSIAYSNTLMNFGLQLFSFSLVTIMFTRMSELLAEKDFSTCDVYIEANLNKMVRLVVPACLGLSMVSTELVSVLFERGAFTAADTARTAGVLSMYLLGLPALIFNSLITRIFHSLQRMRAKMWLSLQYLLTNTAGNFLLIKAYKVMGLAISSTVAINVHLFLSLLVLHVYGLGLGIGRYTAIILRAYMVAMVTWVLFKYSGLENWFDGFLVEIDLINSIGLGVSRFFVVCVIYYILYFSFTRLWPNKTKGK
jgi:putative peptidoglycan lipid II flippase